MSGKLQAHRQAATATAVMPARPVLQRACACGQHTTGGGECETCRGREELPAPAQTLIRPKLTVSHPADVQEEEADRVAEAVLDGRAGPGGAVPWWSPRAHSEPDRPARRQADEERDEDDEDDERIPRSAQPGGPPTVTRDDEARLDALEGSGEPLPEATRSFFESRFGRDLAAVRLHSDPGAVGLATRFHAHAFTRGQHIFFAPGRYQPDTPAGRRLLAHELTHTLQDRDAVSSVADTVRRQAAGAAALAEPPTAAPEDPILTRAPGELPPGPAEPGPERAAGPAREEATGPAVPARGGVEAETAEEPAGPEGVAAPGVGEAAAGEGAAGEGGPAPAPAAVETSAEGALLQSLATVPVSSFGQSVTSAQRAAGELHARERAELTENLPEIDRPTGLPPRPGPPEAAPTTLEAGQVPEPEPPVAAGPAALPDTTHEAARGPLPAERVETHVEEPAEEDGGSWWDWLSGALGSFLRRIPTTDPALDTSAGERPRVDTSGEADTAQNENRQRAAGQEVAARRAEADAATRMDFGEHDIYPDAAQGTMRPAHEPGPAPEGPGGEAVGPAEVPDVVRAGVDRAGAGWLRSEVDQRAAREREDRADYEQQSAEAQAESDRQIAEATARARGEQEDARGGAAREVAEQRDRWREENRRVHETYGEQATVERNKADTQIDTQIRDTEQRADAELTSAERQAEQKKQETERKAEEKKREAENRPSGFWNRLRGAVSDFFDALKEAVNALFDALRRFVRDLIERAKRLVREWIEAARRAVVGAIRAFGEALKVVASVALAAFPETAKRVRGWIDDRVEGAVDTVNKAAEVLQEAAQRALDALGAALDFVLSVYQRAYLLLLDGLRFLAVGLVEIMERIGHLVEAAQQMPSFFIGQATEELVGQDLTAPLPFERTATTPPSPRVAVAAAVQAGAIDTADARALTSSAVGDADVAVDQVAPLDLSPELLASVGLSEGEEREFGESSDPSRSVPAIQEEVGEGATAGAPALAEAAAPAAGPPVTEPATAEPAGTEPTPEPAAEAGASPTVPATGLTAEQETERQLQKMMNAPQPACPKEASQDKADQSKVPEEMKFGPLTTWQRGRYLVNQMIKGVKNWFACNWPWLLAGAIVVLTVLIVLEIVTGGAITAALPPLMELIGMIMLGVAAVRVAGFIGEYLTEGWAGRITSAARSLARGLAVGAIELVFTLLFDLNSVIKAAKQGLTATLRGALTTARRAGGQLISAGRRIGRGVVRTVRAPGRAAALVGRVVVRRGRIILQGLRRGFGRGVRSLDDLAKQLWNMVRFRRFKLVRRGWRIQLWGFINPWVLLADGSIVEAAAHEVPAGTRVGEAIELQRAAGRPAERGILVAGGEDILRSDAEAILRHATSQTMTPGPNFIRHFQDHRHLLEGVVGRKFPGNPVGHADFLAELTRMANSGQFRPIGLTVVREGGLTYAFEGSFRRLLPDGQIRTEALTLLMRPNGEWVTLLRSGGGMANEAVRNLRLRF